MSDENNHSTSPFNVWWWVAGGFLLLIVVLVVVALVGTSRGSDDSQTGPSDPSPTMSADSPDAPATPNASGNACDLPAAAEIPVAGPEASWEAVGYFMVPTSPEYGPVATDDSAWPCFAQSPTGALFAAAHFFAGLGEPDYADFVEASAVDNQARAVWVSAQDPDTRVQLPGRVAQIAGFQFQQVEPDRVVVDLGMQQDTVEASVRVGLVWDEEAGNWRGDFSLSQISPSPVDLATFTKWGASDG